MPDIFRFQPAEAIRGWEPTMGTLVVHDGELFVPIETVHHTRYLALSALAAAKETVLEAEGHQFCRASWVETAIPGSAGLVEVFRAAVKREMDASIASWTKKGRLFVPKRRRALK